MSSTTSSEGSTLIEQIVDFAHSLEWEDLPVEVQDHAKDRVLDAFSTAVASRDIDVTRAALGSLDGGQGRCTVLPTGTSGTMNDAAFANGVAVHAILFEDIHIASADHPGAVVVPAALAGTEVAAGVVGRTPSLTDFLAATSIGYEVQLHLGSFAADGVKARGFRTTSVFGAVAAAAAVAKVWRLSRVDMANALGLAANFAFGLLEGWAHGTMEPFLHSGMAARAGVTATMLARCGAVAAPTTLEGSNGYLRAFADVTADQDFELGRRWRIHDVLCKSYPISGAKLTAVDSALAVRQRLVDAERSGAEIRKVVVCLSELAFTFPGGDRVGPFETMAQAQDSTQFCVSSALLGRRMSDVETFTEGFRDREIAELTHRVELVRGAPDRVLGLVEVTLEDGSVISEEVDWQDHHHPSIEKMAEKLRLLAVPQWTAETTDEVIKLITSPGTKSVLALSRLLQR
jgi:2-methylcitrate dehydratase PrpD